MMLAVSEFTKRAACGLLVFALSWGSAAAWAANTPTPSFKFSDVQERARKLAAESYVDGRGAVPDWLLEINYDEWRDIRFRAAEALWRKEKLPFEVQFFHPGLFYDRPVVIHSVDAQGAKPLTFSPSLFDYGRNRFASRVPQRLGFAGFRFHYPLKKADYKDEVIAFLGASYFRAVSRDTAFGVSARGLAIDTASPSGEEFPFFKEFWLVRPTPKAKEVEVYALLDSPRVAGAYRFVVHPGNDTYVDVEATLYLRDGVDKLGLAPLTSMFFVGENNHEAPRDYRPEVHDSDGMLIALGGGEWIWRPLGNPKRLRLSTHAVPQLAGFGLLQRDRNFDHYQDLETRPEVRPSVWITPRGDWGPGRIELIEIPTQSETNDNIVAFWVSDKPTTPEKPVTVAYRMTWNAGDSRRPPGGRVEATRHDRGTLENAHRFIIDFTGKDLAKLDASTVLEGAVTVGKGDGAGGEILEQQVQKNPVTNGWRLTFQVRPASSDPVELRAFLRRGEDVLTETWSYVLEPW